MLLLFGTTGCRCKHDFREANCTSPRTCKNCGDTEGEALGHKWKDATLTEPKTCELCEETEGASLYYPNTDRETETEIDTEPTAPTIAANKVEHIHNYNASIVNPTCIAEGYTVYECSCGDSYTQDYINAYGHNWGGWITIQKATVNNEGQQTRTCSSCGATEKQTIPSLPFPTGNKITLNGQDKKEQPYYEANISAGLRENMSEHEAVSKINKWLCETLTYELGYVLPLEVLESGKAQCEGYSLLFYAMCRNAGIECNLVSGKTMDGNGQFVNGHTWSQVKIGATWYYIDVCWNDVDTDPNLYFLSETLWDDHQVSYVSEYGKIYF